MIEAASPCPRRLWSAKYQLKQSLSLFACCCSGRSRAKPKWSASSVQPLSSSNLVALCVQPWSATTRGAPAGRPSGTYLNMRRLPGFGAKLGTCTVSAACAADTTAARTHADSTVTIRSARPDNQRKIVPREAQVELRLVEATWPVSLSFAICIVELNRHPRSTRLTYQCSRLRRISQMGDRDNSRSLALAKTGACDAALERLGWTWL